MVQHMQQNMDMNATEKHTKEFTKTETTKIHLVGHSMGGQTIRQLEELLRNGSREEIEYQNSMVAKFLRYSKGIMTI